MNWWDYEKFAKENNITTTEVEGTMGCGYACSCVYFEPESVIKCIQKRDEEIKGLRQCLGLAPVDTSPCVL